MTASRNYTVGYARPPKSGQFKKGQSGNPRGRPKQKSNLLDEIFRILRKKVRVTEGGRHKQLSRWTVMVSQLTKKAMEGDIKAVMAFYQIIQRETFSSAVSDQPAPTKAMELPSQSELAKMTEQELSDLYFQYISDGRKK